MEEKNTLKSGDKANSSVDEHSQQVLPVNELLAIRRQKLVDLIQLGKDPYKETKFDRNTTSRQIVDSFDEFENTTVKLAGRLMSKRIMGKASFGHIRDGVGQIQLYFRADNLGTGYEEYKKLDIGDIIGIEGKVFLTKMGEISVEVQRFVLLTKSLLPLPEKWHGLTDTDLRYRQRYVDFIANPSIKDVFVVRSKIIRAIRQYLDSKGYLEVDTPILNTVVGGASARPFVTYHNTLDIDLFLRIAPELYLKRLIVGGFEKVYELGRMFRNEGMSTKHNPEFTMIELYSAYDNLYAMIAIVEDIFVSIAKELNLSDKIKYQGHSINIVPPFAKISMVDAVKQYSGIDFYKVDSVYMQCKQKGLDVNEGDWGNALYKAFEHFVEDKLVQPTFILDYPIEVSPLAKKKIDDSRLTERFELFVAGREMGNAYTELNDPVDQADRFAQQESLRQKGDDEAQQFDSDFVTALEYGMPPTGGLGIGIDRLVMLFTDSSSIRDVLLFPTMKPVESGGRADSFVVDDR